MSASKGPYRLIRRVGEGAMGEVWEAVDSRLDRRVALKILKTGDPEALERFRREAALVARLSHPNLAAVYEAGEDFIAMEFIDGETLQPGPQAVRQVRDAARAIACAHEHGVIHRDLKPENLMVDRSGRVYVTDFGLARSTLADRRLSMSGMVVGTPCFMSPEQARGRNVDARTDVFGLGAALYALLTGRPPHGGSDTYEVLRNAIEKDPPPPECDADLRTIVMKCLEKDPVRRYASASALADDLTRHLDGEPILARRPSLGYRLRKRLAKRKALVAVAGISIALTVGILLPRWLAEKREKEELRELNTLWTELVVAREWTRQGFRTPAEVRAELTRTLARVSDFVQRHPDRPQGYYVRARGRTWLGDLDSAEADLRRVLELEPGFRPAWSLLGQIELERYQYELYRSGDRGQGLKRAAPYLARAQDAFAKAGDGAFPDWGLASTAEDRNSQVLGQALQAHYVQRDLGRALELLAEGDPSSEELVLWLGILSDSDEDRLRYLDRALVIAPHFAKGYLHRGTVQVWMEHWEEGESDLNRAFDLDPNLTVALLNRALVRMKRKDWEGAAEDAKRAIEAGPDRTEGYIHLGNARLGQGRTAEAIEAYGRAIAIDSEALLAWTNRGIAHKRSGNLPGALADFDEALRIDPADINTRLGRAEVRRLHGDRNGERDEYNEIIDRAPQSPVGYYNRGVHRLAEGDTAGAGEDFDQTLVRDPDHLDGRLNRAVLRTRLADFEGALADYEDGIRRHPKDGRFWIGRGAMRVHFGDLDGAFEDYGRAVSVDSPAYEAYYNRALIRLDRKDRLRAAEDLVEASRRCAMGLIYERLAEMFFVEPPATREERWRDWRGRVGAPDLLHRARGRLHAARDELDDALAQMDQAVQASPKSAEAYFDRAEIWKRKNDVDGVTEDLTQGLMLDPRNAKGWSNRGVARKAKGDLEGARADFEEALRVAPPDWPGRASVEELLRAVQK